MLWAALFFLGHPVKGDPSTTDSDQDGYTDEEETNSGYNPNDPTSYPGYEYTIDSDQDGHTDYVETSAGTDPNDANSYPGSTPPPSPDSDNDGHSDADETAAGTNPNDATSYPGSSGGTSGDPYSTDSDGDGFTDGVELDYGTDPHNSESYPAQGPEYSPDTDGDGFTDAVEGTEGTDPNNASSYPNSPYLIDSDSDGWSDGAENDALTNPYDPSSYPNAPDPYTTDADGDGYTDYQEGVEGTNPNDPTSYPGYLNSLDSDGDGHYDADEIAQGYDPADPNSYPGMTVGPIDTDGDGHSDEVEIQSGTNPYDSSSYPGSSYDSDGDGYSDYEEGLAYTDPHDASSYPGSGGTTDTDGDGLADHLESSYGTDVHLSDTDGDGLSDGAEVAGFSLTIWIDGYGHTETFTTGPTTPDTDGDLLLDGWELQNGYSPVYGADGLSDLDGDGLSLGQEVALHGTNPASFDTDEDGEGDGYELSHSTDPLDPDSHSLQDSDSDGMSDEWESAHGLNPQDPSDAVADGDEDQLINYREFVHRANPANSDTDGDGYLDGFEWSHQFDPADASDAATDTDGDLMPDLWELFYGLNPDDSADQSSDLDGDQLPAHAEFVGGYNPTMSDTDGDGISDYDEFYGTVVDDSDGDGLFNVDETGTYQTDPNNADTDGDGLSDYAEIFGTVHSIETPDGPVGVSFTTSPLLPDTDGDGMGDFFEILHFFDPTDSADGAEDEDGDGLTNGDEHSIHLTNVFSADTDGDGESDSLEIAQNTDPRSAASNSLDTDGDLMRTSWEIANGLDPDNAADATGDPDGDLLVNLEEFRKGTNPHSADSDGDGFGDRLEIQLGFDPTDASDAQTDSDGDTMPDLWEIAYGLSYTDTIDTYSDPDEDGLYNIEEYGAGTKPNLADSDVDGLGDGEEYNTYRTALPGQTPSHYFTNPANADTDNDGFQDGFELERDWHPCNPIEGTLDADGDGLTNRAEILVHRTNWEVADTDNDGESDGYEIAHGTNPLNIQSRSQLDSDGDHMSDTWETAHGLDPQVPNGGADPDSDGLNNHGEFLAGTHPLNPDCDNDGYLDGLERTYGKNPLSSDDADDDEDSDGLPDLWEMKYGLPWQDADHGNNDPEGDGIDNLNEFQHGSDPNSHESDGDGIVDSEEIAGQGTTHTGIEWNYAIHPGKRDTDGDTQDDLYEILNGKDPTNPNSFVAATPPVVIPGSGTFTDGNILAPVDGSAAPTSPHWTFGVVADSDGDGVADARELQDGTDPHDGTLYRSPLAAGADADRDGLSDDWETVHGLDPADASQGWRDPDYDRLNNRREQAFGTTPFGTWAPLPLSGMIPDGPRSGQDPRFPTSTLATLNDFGEMARVSLESGQLLVSLFQNGAWGAPSPIPLPHVPLSVGEVLRNNFGLMAIEIRVSTSGSESVLIVVRGSDGAIRLVGEGQSWTDVTDLRLTDSGFLAGRCVGPLPTASESVFRWRKGELLVLPHPGQVKLKGLGERGQILEETLGLYENGAWNASAAGPFVLGSYGEILPASGYPTPGALFPYARYQSLSQHGEVVSGVSPVDPTEVLRGYHARVLSRGGEFIVTEDDWLHLVDQPYLDDPEIPVGGDWIAGAGASYTYDPGGSSPSYQFDFDYDDDGFWNALETQAGVSANDPTRFPGWDANVVVSDANRAGDFVGWIYRGTTRIDQPSGLEFPANDAYLWQYRDFSYFGGADHIWVLNNTGSFIASDQIGVEAPDFATSGLHVPTHSFRLFRPSHDTDNDGMADDWEAFHSVASASADLDGDGLTAREEFVFGTSPNHTDTDGDGMRDAWELRHGANPVRRENALVGDSDGDTLDWRAEAIAGTDPYLADTDGDRVRDDWEVKHRRNPLSASDGLPASGDFDHDGYTNEQEWINGTDPFELRSNSGLVDTDQDQMPDVWEVLHGLNPNNPTDAAFDLDSDGLTNAQEYENGSAPNPVWRWVPFTPSNVESAETSHYGNVPNFVGSLNDLGQIATAVRSGDFWSLHIWDRGQWGTAIPLGAVPGFTRVEAVRMNNFGLVAVQLRNMSTLRVRIAIRAPGSEVVWLGNDRPWQAVRDLAVTDSGFVGGNAYLAGDPVGWAAFAWRKGVNHEYVLPPGEQFRRGLSERGEMVATDSVLRRGQWAFHTGGYPLGVGPYGNLVLNHRPSNPWDAQHAKALDKTSFISPSGHRFLSSRIAVNGPWMGTLSVMGSNGVPIEMDFPSFIPYEGGEPLQTGTYGSDMNRKGAIVGFQVAEVSGTPKYAAFHWDGLSRLRSYVSTEEPFGTPFVPSDSRFYQVNDSGQILTWAGTSEEVWDELNQTTVTVSENHWGLRVPHADGDHDGMADDWERYHGLTDPAADADFDGLANRVEFALGLDPNERGSDGDRIDDRWEVAQGVDPSASDAQSTDDLDGDGLFWTTEYLAGTDPYSSDSDRDGIGDGEEDADRDALTNSQEQAMGTLANRVDSDGDGIADALDSEPMTPRGKVYDETGVNLHIENHSEYVYKNGWHVIHNGRKRLYRSKTITMTTSGGVSASEEDDGTTTSHEVSWSGNSETTGTFTPSISLDSDGPVNAAFAQNAQIRSTWTTSEDSQEFSSESTETFTGQISGGTGTSPNPQASGTVSISGSHTDKIENETENFSHSFFDTRSVAAPGIPWSYGSSSTSETQTSFTATWAKEFPYGLYWIGEGSETVENHYTGRIPDSELIDRAFDHAAPGPELWTVIHALVDSTPNGYLQFIESPVSRFVSFDRYNDFSDYDRGYVNDGSFQWEVEDPDGRTIAWREGYYIVDEANQRVASGYILRTWKATDRFSPIFRMGTINSETPIPDGRVQAHWFAGMVANPVVKIQANTGDQDVDGVPDFADGIEGVLDNAGHVPYDKNDARLPETRELHLLLGPDAFANLPPGATATFKYSFSDPAGVVRRTDPSPLQAEFEPGTGALRLWKRDPLKKNQGAVSARTAGDLIRPDQAVSTTALADGVFLESVRPSVKEGDQTVRVNIDPGDGSAPVEHYFRFTSLGMTRLAVLPDGSLSRHVPFHRSLSNPTVEFDPIQVSNIRYDAESDSVLGDLVVSGKVRSELCDMTPGERGTIESLSLGVNSAEFSDSLADVSVSKTHNPADRRRPFPYLGTFNKTLSGVPLEIGENVIEALAADPGTGNTGGGRAKFTVEAVAPAGAGAGLLVSNLTVAFPLSDPALAPGTIRIVAQDESGANLTSVLAVDPADPLRYANTAGDVVLEFEEVPDLNAGEIDRNGAVVTAAALGWSGGFGFALKETGATTGVLAGRDEGALLATLDPSEWQISLGEIGASESDDPGEIHPVRILLEGPETLLEKVEEIGDGLEIRYRAVKDAVDGKYYLGGPKEEGSEVYVPFQYVRTAAFEQIAGPVVTGIVDLITGVERDVPNNQVTLTTPLEYNWGIAKGLAYYAGDLVEDTGSLAKFAVHRGTQFGWVWEFTAGDSMEGEFASIAHTRERTAVLSPKLIDFTWRVLQGETALAEALLAGDPAALEAAGPEHWMVKDLIATLLLEGAVAMENLTWEQKGIVVGYLMPEIIQIVGASAVGTTIGPEGSVAAGGAKAAHTLTRLVAVVQRLRSSSKVAGVIQDLGAVEKLEDLLDYALLWERLDGLADSDKIFKILEYHRLLNPPGLTKWEIFEKAAPDLRKLGRDVWRGDVMRPTVDDCMEELYEGYANGTYGLAKIPTIARMREVVKGLGGRYDVSTSWEPMLESHHIVPTYVQKYFDILNPNHTLPLKNGKIDFDQSPALSIWSEDHRGAGDSIHGRMKGVIPVNDIEEFQDSEDLFNRIVAFYENSNRPGESQVVRDWLNLHGLP